MPRIEASLWPAWKSSTSIAGAMAIYSAVATGMITLTGIVFSLVFVMVQFSAIAYSPRLVLWISRDPLIFHAIGVFTATFLYAIAALAWVDRSGSGMVPVISVWLVVALLLISIGVFVGLVHRLKRLQIGDVLRFIGNFGRNIIDGLYPAHEPSYDTAAPPDFSERPVTQALFYSGPPRAIQSLDVNALLACAEESGGVIDVAVAVGDTVVESTLLLRIYGPAHVVSERDLRRAVGMGAERTFQQDPKYAIRLIVDIAIRALSPAVNDPTTAVQALDQIEDLLVRLGRRRLEVGEIHDGAGRLKVVIPVPSWDDFLELAFAEIREYGETSLQVVRRLKALLRDLMDALPADRHPALRFHQKRLDTAILGSFPDSDDYLRASMEDREGLGVPRRAVTQSRSA
jgi:uncharacterized membrane protein